MILSKTYLLKMKLSQASTVSWNENLELSLDPVEHSERKMGQVAWASCDRVSTQNGLN